MGQEDPLEQEMATHSSILARKSHGQRSLAGYSPQGHKESDTTEQLNNKSVTWEHSVSRPWAAARTPLSRNVWRGPVCLLGVCLSNILLRESRAKAAQCGPE